MIRTTAMTAMWLNAMTSANNAIRAARIEELNGRTDDDRDGNRTVGAESFTAVSVNWWKSLSASSFGL